MLNIYRDRVRIYGICNVIKGLFHKHPYLDIIWTDINTLTDFKACYKCGKRRYITVNPVPLKKYYSNWEDEIRENIIKPFKETKKHFDEISYIYKWIFNKKG